MSDESLNSWALLDTIVYRTPALPMKLSLGTEDEEVFNKLVAEEWFLESIFVASPTLYSNCVKYNSGVNLSHRQVKRIKSSVNNYYSRMQTRCTPYGIFAGCGTAKWGNKNEIKLTHKNIVTFLDIELQLEITECIINWEGLFEYITFFPNNSIYRKQNKLRYLEYYKQKGDVSPQISSVEIEKELEVILTQARSGVSVVELVSIMSQYGLSQQNISQYLRSMVKEKLLISEFTPRATGEEFLLTTIEKLKGINSVANHLDIIGLIKNLVAIKTALAEVTNKGHLYCANIINKSLDELNIRHTQRILFNTQLYLDNQKGILNKGIQHKLLKTVRFLEKISKKDAHGRLQKFRSHFEAAYGDQFVPLLNVLDSNSGISYPGIKAENQNPILEGINPGNKTEKELKLELDETSKIIYDKILIALRKNNKIIELSDEDFEEINHCSEKLPSILSLSFNVISSEDNKIQFQYANRGIDFITRFMNNDEILQIGKKACKIEDAAHIKAIVAEVSHLPEGRGGNIVNRPILREHEIPVISLASVESEKQIDLGDLYIQVNDDRVNLVDVKGREVIPRLTSAHNYHSSKLAIYRFLCDLQNQYYDKNVIRLEIDDFLEISPYVPRIVYSDVIISPATWKFPIHVLNKLKELGSDIKAIKKWQKYHEVPNLVCIIKGDNLHLVNFNDLNSIEIALQMIKHQNEVVFREFLFDPANKALITDKNGNPHTNECIAFLNTNQNQNFNNAILGNTTFSSKSVLKYPPGAEWLYYKIYCTENLQDNILIKVVKPLVDYLKARGYIDSWFFIRYADPDTHIRFRMRASSQQHLGSILSETYNMFQASSGDEIKNIELCTYIPEIVRYGNDLMEFSEKLFEIDSEIILQLIKFTSINDSLTKWPYALRAIDIILDVFGYDLKSKLFFVEQRFNSFFKEHHGDKKLNIELDKKYREKSTIIADIMEVDLSESQKGDTMHLLLSELTVKLNILINEYKSNLKNTDTIAVGSYCHMMVNRVFETKQRTCEMTIFHLLLKFYKSKNARIKMQIK